MTTQRASRPRDGILVDKPRHGFPWGWMIVLLPLIAGGIIAVMLRDDTIRYTFMMTHEDGAPVRWNPCEPIRYVVNPDGAPERGEQEVHEAFEAVSEASGLQFEFDGHVDEPPVDNREAYQPDRYPGRWAPVLVAWASENDTSVSLEPAHFGRAGPVAVSVGESERVYVSGQIVMSRERFQRPRREHSSTLLHEIAHVVGLGHVDDPREIMHPQSSRRASELGPGDREGMRLVGADQGCLDTPPPGRVSP